jgi:hypothetical protein
LFVLLFVESISPSNICHDIPLEALPNDAVILSSIPGSFFYPSSPFPNPRSLPEPQLEHFNSE